MTGDHDGDAPSRLPRWLIVLAIALSVAPWTLRLVGLYPPEQIVSSVVVHGLLEWSTVCASLFTALIGWLYLRVRANVLVATIALASFGSGLWDGLHALAGLGVLEPVARPSTFVPLTWTASRLLEGLVLTIGALYVLRRGMSPPRPVTVWGLGLAIAALAGSGFFYLLTREELPRSWFPEAAIARPYDLAPLALFALGGLVLFPLLTRRHPGMLSEVLLLSAVPDALAQLHMVFGTFLYFDAYAVFAHFTKLVASIVPLAGIGLFFAGAFRREADLVRDMERLVDELRTAQEDMRVSETRFNQLTENIREVFWISNSDGSEMTYVSPAYEEIFGLSVEELYEDARSFLSIVHPDERAVMEELVAAHVVEEFETEYRIVRPDGELRWLRTRGFPVRDDSGEVYRVAGISEDVTEHKLAEEALRRSEARIRALFQAVPDLVLRLDRGGVILDYHARGQLAAVPPPREFVGRRVPDLLRPLEDRVGELLRRTLDSGTMESVELRMESSAAAMDLEARIVRSAEDEVLMLVRNITDQKQLESEVLDISHREQLRLGHDLHDGILQQLTGIALLARVLQQQLEARGAPQHERAEQIRSLVEDAIAQTRTLSRGLAPVELEHGNLSAALEQLAVGVERIHPVRCVCRCEEVSIGDPTEATHLYRIAQEAVSNAVKHGAPTTIVIELARRNGKLRLSVRDDGTGIDEGRAASSSGMGFHIMRYRARRIEATLDVRPAIEGGTVVTCEWPEPALRPGPARSMEPASSGPG